VFTIVNIVFAISNTMERAGTKLARAQLVGMGGRRKAAAERMEDDLPSLKLRRDKGDEDVVPARAAQNAPFAPSISKIRCARMQTRDLLGGEPEPAHLNF
jgi:hypothetical protein